MSQRAAVFTCRCEGPPTSSRQEVVDSAVCWVLAWLMRLPPIAPEHLSAEQRDLYDDMVEVIERGFGELIARRDDGTLIGPFTLNAFDAAVPGRDG